jgi:hypothetical protein
MKSTRISFSSLLFIVFLVLKLTNVISWSWIWVSAPLWIPMIIFFVCLLFFGTILLILKSLLK